MAPVTPGPVRVFLLFGLDNDLAALFLARSEREAKAFAGIIHPEVQSWEASVVEWTDFPERVIGAWAAPISVWKALFDDYEGFDDEDEPDYH